VIPICGQRAINQCFRWDSSGASENNGWVKITSSRRLFSFGYSSVNSEKKEEERKKEKSTGDEK